MTPFGAEAKLFTIAHHHTAPNADWETVSAMQHSLCDLACESAIKRSKPGMSLPGDERPRSCLKSSGKLEELCREMVESVAAVV